MDCQTVATNTDQAGSYMYATVEVSEKILHNNGKLYISGSYPWGVFSERCSFQLDLCL